MSKNMNFVFGMLVVPLVLIAFAIVHAGSVTIPNTFTAGTPAVAADVNANFAAVKAAVDDNDARIDAIAGIQVFAQRDQNGPGTTVAATGQKEMNSININVPTAGVLVISGQVFINNNDTAQSFAMVPKLDAVNILPTPFAAAFNAAADAAVAAENFTLSYTTSTTVTAGAHTVSHTAGPFSGTASFFHNQESLTVVFYPTGVVTPVNTP